MSEAEIEAMKQFLSIGGDDAANDASLTFMLSMESLPTLDADAMKQTISAYEPIDGEINVHLLGNDMCAGTVEFGNHRFRYMGIDAPLPSDAYDGPLGIAHLEEQYKEQFRSGQAHVLLWYMGSETDPIERYIAMYKVVDCFAEGFCGLLNSTANLFNSSITPVAMRDYILQFRQGIPPLMLVNVMLFHKEDGSTWYVSSGNHVFGLPEFCYLGAQGQLQTVVGIFQTLMWNAYQEGRSLDVGDQLDLKGYGFTLQEMYEYQDYIVGDSDIPHYVLQPDDAGKQSQGGGGCAKSAAMILVILSLVGYFIHQAIW